MGFFNLIYDLIVITGSVVIGIGGAFYITSLFVYSTPSNNLLEEDEEEPDFDETYREEFEKLEIKERPSNDTINDFVSSLNSPIGEIVMTYNPEVNTFYYYSDRRTIPIRFLDVGAQKFVIDNDCKILYEEEPLESDAEEPPAEQPEPELETESYYNWLTSYFYQAEQAQAEQAQAEQAQAEQAQAEQAQAEQAQAEQAQAEQAQAEQDQAEQDQSDEESSVFASYKKNPEINRVKAQQIEKIMNRYKYCGTLIDYETNKEKQEEEALNISFIKYKEIVKNKNE